MKTPAILQAFNNDILPSGAQLLQADDPVEIGGHRLTGRLRSSGAGVVYLACDRGGGLVTVTTAHAGAAETEAIRARLRTEASCARRLPAGRTARLLRDATEETPPFLVGEHLEGHSLERIVDVKGPLPAAMVTAVADDLARLLAAIHEADVIHGNLTPANVLLTKDGLRVIDLGVGQEISGSGGPAEIGAVADNPGWLAPELFAGGPHGPACDVFGWGCLVTYAATGHSPHAETAGPAPLDRGALDAPLRRLVNAAVGADPAGRPTAADLLARLAAAEGEGVDEDEPPGPAADPPAPRRRRVRVRATASALLALATLLVAGPTGTERPPDAASAPPPSALAPPSHPGGKPSSNTAAMALYDAPPAAAAPRKAQAAAKGAARPPGVVRMSCSSARSAWCTIPGAGTVTATPRSSGWRIRWTAVP